MHGGVVRRLEEAGLSAVKKKADEKKRRSVLVILSNRWNRNQKLRYFELEADAKGNIHQERPLRSAPREAKYDEVWENDQGKTDVASCNRFSRKYPHPLEKPKTA
jgi:hypothetical protein